MGYLAKTDRIDARVFAQMAAVINYHPERDRFSGYLLRTDAWSYPVLRLKRLGLSKTFRRLVVTLTRRYGVSLIHLDASAECLPDLPTFDW